MIRLSKLADYGIVISTHLARHADRQQTALEIAAATSVPSPMASKILKLLVRSGTLQLGSTTIDMTMLDSGAYLLRTADGSYTRVLKD